MRIRAVLLVIICALFEASPLPAKDPKWIEVSSDHFILFTDTNEMKGRRLVSDFENRIATFAQVFGKVPSRQLPIEIFLFNEEQDFIEALPRIQPAAGQATPPVQFGATPQEVQAENQMRKNGYLVRGPDRLFIIAKDKSPDDIANDVGHALGHAMFERYVIWRPFWLSEGMAEFVRKIGRSADTKPIAEQDAFSTADMFTIVPSGTYNDNDPPTPFRTESYRLVRYLSEQKPELLKQYLQTLHAESDKLPKFPLDGDSIQSDFKNYVETPLKAVPVTAAIKSGDADMAKLAIHRGDLLLATDRQSEAGRWYNADSADARAARAIATRFARSPVEAVRVLDRSAREMPSMGLVQYHFGAVEAPDKKDVPAQVAALERAVQLLPLFGRAFAELARVYALNGQADKALPLVAKALELEPEYADHFLEVRADVELALGRSAQSLHDINIASDLPHVDRSAIEHYNLKIAAVRKRIEAARRDADYKDLVSVRDEANAERDRREPLQPPPPPPPPVPNGSISYEIETRAPIEVVDSSYPDYAEALRRKGAAGTITVLVDIGPDGKVKTASVVNSQITDMNKATLDAVKKWSFKPGNRSLRLVFKFALQ